MSLWFGRRGGGSRERIGLAFSTLALLLFGTIGVLSAQQARSGSEREAAEALQQLAEQLARRLDDDMIARSREVDGLTSLEALLDVHIEAGRWRTLLERLQAGLRHYSWIGVTDANGRVVAATGGLLEGRDVSQRPWFREGSQGSMVGDVHEAQLLAPLLGGSPTGEPLRFVDVAAPLRQGGRLTGVIGAHLTWGWAEERRRELLATISPDRRIEIVLTDREGRILLGPSSPATPASRGARSAGLQTWSDGLSYLTAASPSRASGRYPGMGWTVVVRQPEAAAFATATAVQRKLWLMVAAGVVAFGTIGWWIAGRLTEPWRRIAQTARDVAPGVSTADARDVAPGVSTADARDEVSEVARSLALLSAGLRRREQALDALNESLDTRVRERTMSLEKANEALRSFSRSLSHDVSGPLGSMALVLRNLISAKSAPLPADASRAIAIVAAECERLRQLTEELLTLAMVEERDLCVAAVDSQALAREALAEVLAGSQASPQVRVDALPSVRGDPVLLRQVWVNLMSNAVKFTSKVAQPLIVASAAEEGSEIVFCVADNGAGFDPSQAARLFGVFQRLHSPSQFPGTGVGLSIVRRAVQRHGGRVWAESLPGTGARFFFTLPRREDQ